MKEYKGYKYFKDNDGLWKVVLNNHHFFVVALDDSKTNGRRKVYLSRNNAKTCREYINWLNE